MDPNIPLAPADQLQPPPPELILLHGFESLVTKYSRHEIQRQFGVLHRQPQSQPPSSSPDHRTNEVVTASTTTEPTTMQAASTAEEMITQAASGTSEIHRRRDISDRVEVPDIYRTVIQESGSLLSRERTYCRLTEEEYESIKDSNLGNAFEIQKIVKLIQPPADTSKPLPQGNPLFGGAIVDSVVSEKIIIRCPLLLKAIKETVYWPSSAYNSGSRQLAINTPYRSIGVHREDFRRLSERYREDLNVLDSQELARQDVARKKTELETSIKHLDLFLEVVDNVQAESIELEQSRYSRKVATFDMLWMILKPGTYVYVPIEGTEIAARVRLLVWDSGPFGGIEDAYMSVTVHLWYLDHNGAVINRKIHKVEIPRFDGEKPIVDLAAYPEEFAPENSERRASRTAVGRKYLSLIKNQFELCLYNGLVSSHKSNPFNSQFHRAYQGKVIVDPQLHYRENGGTEGAIWVDEADTHSLSLGPEMKTFTKVDPQNDATVFTDDHCFLLSPWVRGFTISTRGERRWVWLNVNAIDKYEPNRDLILTVALPDDKLAIIRALTYRPDLTKDDGKAPEPVFSPDYIEHKGEGRVIILHGVPGLGKTYSVECMAEWSNRPLLRLTCAELGLDPKKLEGTLETYLRRAERWKALVLIDEADVFIGKRSTETPTDRQALVAVFLRALEYYSGIIFLTTNRIDEFDLAIIDRTLLVVGFDPLQREQRMKIRRNCLAKLELEGTFGLDTEALCAFERLDEEKYDWDGREIVQVVKLAGILAQWDHYKTSPQFRPNKIVVQKTHMESAMKIVRKHTVRKEYYQNVKGEVYDKQYKKEDAYQTDRMG